jgi:hypothetical protein
VGQTTIIIKGTVAVAAAVSLSINASGAVSLSTTPLLTPQEIDQARKRTIDYRPPGH